LPPLIVSQKRIERIRLTMPELPDDRAKRYQKDFKIPEYDSKVIATSKSNSDYFEQLVLKLQGIVEPKIVSNFFMTDILRVIKLQEEQKTESSVGHIPVSVEHSAILLKLQADGIISGRTAKDVFEIMLQENKSPDIIVQEKGFVQISDDSAVESICAQVLEENQDKLHEYLSGKEKLFGFFVGQAMKVSQGQLNPSKANQILKKLIDSHKKS